MFDKLIVTEPEGADFKNRGRYFMVSTLVVGVFFATAVVFSIYAADLSLGNRDFELVSMLTPPDLNAAEPDRQQQSQPKNQSAKSESDIPTRQANIARTDESTIAPTSVSTTPNTQMSRPPGTYRFDYVDTNPGGGGNDVSASRGTASGPSGLTTVQPSETKIEEEEPPVKRDPPAIKKPAIQSLGVINGIAANLPKPAYPATAKAVGASGKVSIQVLIDESGRVVSAKSVDGHPLLRPAAEDAAKRASFTPTLLSGVPVKVTGVIIYNFTK